MQIIYTNYANNYQVILVDCIIITIIIIIVITNLDVVCHYCCYSHLFWLCLGAGQERCPSVPYTDEQLPPQRIYKLGKPNGCRRGGRDGRRVLGGRADSQRRHSLPRVFISWSVELGWRGQGGSRAGSHGRTGMGRPRGRESRLAFLDFLCIFLPGPHGC